MMRGILLAGLVAIAAVGVSAEDKTLGAGITLKQATPIKALVDQPADFVGKTVRVDGVATAVCEKMGCWMAVAASGDKDAKTVRLKVEHDGPIVFPISAKGRSVSAEGVFEEIAPADEHGADAAGEHAKHDASASKKYQIKATGALIKER